MSTILKSIIGVTNKITYYLLYISLFSLLLVWGIWLFESKFTGDIKLVLSNFKPYIVIISVFSIGALCITYIVQVFCRLIAKMTIKFPSLKSPKLTYVQNHVTKTNTYHYRDPKNKQAPAFYIVIALVIVGFILGPIFTPESKNSDGLIAKYNKFAKLNNLGDFNEQYDHYLTPDFKANVSKDKFITNGAGFYKPYFEKDTATIHEAIVNGNIGYIDRTLEHCNNEDCTSKNINRMYKKYVYIDGHWLADLTDYTACPRDVPYSIPPEFERSLSLLIQRFQGSGDMGLSKTIANIKNCLNIQYASNSYEMGQAEGLFNFVPGQSHKKLDILVSPKYIYKDDLITATLLAHEVTHAANYVVGEESGEQTSCFEDEAQAFNNQNFFLTKLNPEELNSLVARLNSGGSIELRQINYVFAEIPRYPGNTMLERAENYVRGNPFYQKQCAGRN